MWKEFWWLWGCNECTSSFALFLIFHLFSQWLVPRYIYHSCLLLLGVACGMVFIFLAEPVAWLKLVFGLIILLQFLKNIDSIMRITTKEIFIKLYFHKPWEKNSSWIPDSLICLYPRSIITQIKKKKMFQCLIGACVHDFKCQI